MHRLIGCLALAVLARATTIQEVQQTTLPGPQGTWPSPLAGQQVTLEGVVGAVGYYGTRWFLCDPAGGPWSGLLIWSPAGSLVVGDRVRVSGTVTEYNGHTELADLSSTQRLGSATAPPAWPVSCAELAGEAWEGVLVRLGAVTVEQAPDSYGQWRVADSTGSVEVDDAIFSVPGAGLEIAPGQLWERLDGIADYQNNARAINPRGLADLQAGPEALLASMEDLWLGVGESGGAALVCGALDPTWDLRSFQARLRWDPALATLDSVSLEGTLAAGHGLAVTTPEPGRAILQVGTGPALSGAGALTRIHLRGLAEGTGSLVPEELAFTPEVVPQLRPGTLTVRRAFPRGDTLTLVQRPLGTLPAFLLPGDSLEVWCAAAPGQSGWWLGLAADGVWRPADHLQAEWRAERGQWRLTARFAGTEDERLWDLVAGADGIPADTVRHAVMGLPAWPESFCFAQVSDTHLPTHLFYPDWEAGADSASQADFGAVLDDLALIHPAFILHTGDLVNEGELEDLQLRRVFSRAQAQLLDARVPLFLSAGNHDVGGWPATPEPAGTARRTWWRFFGWPELDDPPAGAPWRTQNASFDFGPLHVALLEAWDNYDGWRPEIYGETSFIPEQLQWLHADLAASPAPHKVLATHYDFAGQVPAGHEGLELILMGHVHSSSGDGAGPPWRLTTGATTDGARSYRIIRVAPQGLDPRPVLSAGSQGERLRTMWLGPNDGSQDSLAVRVVNQHGEAFPGARLEFLLAAGLVDARVEGGRLLSLRPGPAGSLVEVEFDLPAQSQPVVRVVGRRGPAAPGPLRIGITNGRVLLEWPPHPGATGYRVQTAGRPAGPWQDSGSQLGPEDVWWEGELGSGVRLFRVVALERAS